MKLHSYFMGFIIYPESCSATILFSFGFSCTADEQRIKFTECTWFWFIGRTWPEPTVSSFKSCSFHRCDNNIQITEPQN